MTSKWSKTKKKHMSGLKNLIDKIANVRADLNGSRDRVAFGIASNLYAQMHDRIIRTGKDSDGDRFPGYSTKPLPKFWLYGTGRTPSFDKKVRQEPGKGVSYKRARQLDNLQTEHVDLHRTGEMWQGTGVTIERRLLRSTLIRIEAKTQNAKKKVEWNSERYGGSILENSKTEIEAAKRAWALDRIARIKKGFS